MTPIFTALSYNFRTRDDMKNPRTLQDLMVLAENKNGLVHPLTDRVNLAKKIAPGLLFVHATGFMHKNFNPASIVVFDRKDEIYPSHVGEPFLVGYDLIRKADHASARLKVEDWRQNIHLHPVRHRLESGDEFTMLHDICSCLLYTSPSPRDGLLSRMPSSA